MDRIINVKINGYHLTKGGRRAGVQHEGNIQRLRIEFDSGWSLYTKTVTFWNALGEDPVKIELLPSRLEGNNNNIYLCPVPPEAMTEAGELTFVVDGYFGGVRQRSISDTLEVVPAPYTEEAAIPTDPTPSQAEQLQAEIESIKDTILEAKTSAEEAGQYADEAKSAAESAQLDADTAKLAKSYAVGGTGVRDGEDIDNAKYYAGVARAIANADFATSEEFEKHASRHAKGGEDPLTVEMLGHGARNTKTYKSIAELGITRGTETMETIFAAMPSSSMLTYAVDGKANKSAFPEELEGVLVVDLVDQTYATAMFRSVGDSPRVFVGSWSNAWSGWTELTAEGITYGTKRIPIPSNADLNSYTAIGCYKCSSNTTAATVTNSPIAQAFTLDVITNTGSHTDVPVGTYNSIIQRLTAYSGEMYWRRINGNGTDINYGVWKKVYDSGNFSPNSLGLAVVGTCRQDINSGQDLNALVDVCGYRCKTTSIAKTLANCPTDNQFVMDVISSRGTETTVTANAYGYVVQRILDVKGNEYYRSISCDNTATVNYGPWMSRGFLAGTYIGDGKYGESNKTKLTFPFAPQVVIITTGSTTSERAFTMMVNPFLQAILSGSSARLTTIAWDDNSVSFYSNTNAEVQFNKSGVEYHYKVWG